MKWPRCQRHGGQIFEDGKIFNEHLLHFQLASQHLIPAIWEAAFCYYVAQYLSPGWLKSTVSLLPRIQVVERRRTSRVRSADGNSNSSTTDSPSDVFNSPLQRPCQLYPVNAVVSDIGENYDPDFENLPMLSALRDKMAVEAEAVMNQAVQMSLKVSFDIPRLRVWKTIVMQEYRIHVKSYVMQPLRSSC